MNFLAVCLTRAALCALCQYVAGAAECEYYWRQSSTVLQKNCSVTTQEPWTYDRQTSRSKKIKNPGGNPHAIASAA